MLPRHANIKSLCPVLVIEAENKIRWMERERKIKVQEMKELKTEDVVNNQFLSSP